MNKSTFKVGLLCLLIATLANAPTQIRAQDTNQPAMGTKEPRAATPSSKKVTPFHGKLKAVDKTAKTITLGETKVQITSETKITKEGKPATLEDAVVGEPVSGAYRKSDDGKLTATTVHFGAKPEAAQEKTKKKE